MTADPESLKGLLAVQDHDRTVDALRHNRETLPEFDEVTRIEAAIVALDGESSVISDQRHELERTQKRLEDEVSLLEDRIVTENAKLYGGDVTGMKELQALQEEVAGLEARQILVEDQILEVMEAAEPIDAELEGFAQRRAEHDGSAASTRQSIIDKQAAIDAELIATEEKRAAAAQALDVTLVEEYERIRAQPGKVGVAKLVGSTCRGCHLELPAMEVDRLKKLPADQLIHCDECGCILVR